MTIEREITEYGILIFEKIKQIILENGTKPIIYNKDEHEKNQRKLLKSIDDLIEKSSFNYLITTDQLWALMWQRIMYSGTKSAKATKEIESAKHYKLFENYNELLDSKWNFDLKEWKTFVEKWKEKVGKNNWLKKAKIDSDWENSLKAHFKKSGDSAIQLMTKTKTYEGISFSALDQKMKKYITIARELPKIDQTKPVLEYFTGPQYNFEKEKFRIIHGKFKELLGDITALHLMMDLGFETVKPDRVLTYLFTKLGWLVSLDKSSSKEEIIKKYMREEVIMEVIEKSLILSNILKEKNYKNPTRLLDIWFVKYGQQPESAYGITQTVELLFPLEKLYEEVKGEIGKS